MVFGYTSYAFYIYSRFRTNILFWIERLLPAQRPELKDLTGKTALVTGSNVGIGLEIARGLASRGATVILACRNREKAEGAKKDIVERSGGYVHEEQVEVMVVDVSDLNSVRSLVEEWGTRPLDILVNNAGIMPKTFKKSPQGYEHTYTTNILSHYLLTLLLLPCMRKNGRIVNTSSLSHDYSPAIDVLDLDWSKHLEASGLKEGADIAPPKITTALYSRTKCLQVIFTRELQQRLDRGVVRSTLWERDNLLSPRSNRTRNFIINLFGISTTEGAATGIHLCVSDSAARTPGLYWHHMQVAGANRVVEDTRHRKWIFDHLAFEAELEDALKL
ncbi:hypothetical protein DL96DRAFT_1676465 [Flagelloscypha sp. PMI_526]|nr:hypothetical protein DL96DRAFT_1676465 [Flagelloscypha sp. PMI_526]